MNCFGITYSILTSQEIFVFRSSSVPHRIYESRPHGYHLRRENPPRMVPTSYRVAPEAPAEYQTSANDKPYRYPDLAMAISAYASKHRNRSQAVKCTDSSPHSSTWSMLPSASVALALYYRATMRGWSAVAVEPVSDRCPNRAATVAARPHSALVAGWSQPAGNASTGPPPSGPRGRHASCILRPTDWSINSSTAGGMRWRSQWVSEWPRSG